jgi:hypothetical protein
LIEQLAQIARGEPWAPKGGARRTEKPGAFQVTVEATHRAGDGGLGPGLGSRPITSEDVKKLHVMFNAWTGVDIEDAWKLFLERELGFAHLAHHFAGPEREMFLPGGSPVIVPEVRAKSPGAILADVAAASPLGKIPAGITAKVVEAALENTTSARGGGRGLGAKMNVRTWVEEVARRVSGPQRSNRAAPKGKTKRR